MILLAAVCFQANMRVESGGKYVRPKGFKEVVSLNSSEYPLAGFIIESSEEIIVALEELNF